MSDASQQQDSQVRGSSNGPAPQMAQMMPGGQASGNQLPIQPDMHVRPGQMTYLVQARFVNGQKVVILHIEHATGNNVFPIEPAYARDMADALTKAATGIEIVHG